MGQALRRRGVPSGGRDNAGVGVLGPLLEDHVGVGAASAEGGDAGSARLAVGLPLAGLGQELDLARLPVDFGGGRST